MLHVIWMFNVGIVVGAIARFIMPGSDNLGILMIGVLAVGVWTPDGPSARPKPLCFGSIAPG